MENELSAHFNDAKHSKAKPLKEEKKYENETLHVMLLPWIAY